MSSDEENLPKFYESLKNQLIEIDLDKVNFENIDQNPITKIIDSQKIYFWIRVYLKDEISDLESGDDITIKYMPKNEDLKVKFVYYAKKGVDRDLGINVVNYNTEDDKKIICLMVDSTQVNYNDDIKFMRTLFKQGNHYEYQLLKRNDLEFILDKNNSVVNYYDV